MRLRLFLTGVIGELSQRRLGGADAAMIKLFCTEVQGRAIDRCLQLFGGYGYVREYPHRPPVCRRTGNAHLRRDERGHEEHHLKIARTLEGKVEC